MVRRRTFWLVFTGLAGLLTGVVFGGPARGDLLPTLTTALPTLPIGTTTVPPAPPLPPPPPVPPVPPAPPVPPVPPAPPPPTVTVPPVPPAPILGAPPAPVAVGTGGGETARSSGGKTFFASDRPARVHASRTRFATRGPAARRGTKISFRLARPARVELVVRGPSPSCAVAGTTAVRGRRGVNRVRFTGRFHHRPLAPGTYTITVVALRKGSRHRLGTIPVRVVQPGHAGRGGPRASAMACSASSSPGPASLFALPAAIVRSTTPPTPPAGSHRQPLRPPHVKPPGGILGTGIQPPHIRVPGSTANFGWLTVLLFVMLGVPVILVALYAVRFWRSSPTA